MTQGKHVPWLSKLALSLAGWMLSATVARAQIGLEMFTPVIPGDTGGVAAISNQLDPAWFSLFAIELAVTVALSALIAFHPVTYGRKKSPDELILPRLLLLYGLIGMVIGFLVTQHGYFIGFVIFGIGGLLRFRSNFVNSEITVEVILVTILGLAVGLNLLVMAAMIALASWTIIWFTGRLTAYQLILVCESEEELQQAVDLFRGQANEFDWKIEATDHSFSKVKTEILFRVRRVDSLASVRQRLESLFSAGTTWRLEA